MNEIIQVLLTDYLLLFLMIATGVIFIIAGINGISIQRAIGRYFWRTILWELFCAFPVAIWGFIFYRDNPIGWAEHTTVIREQIVGDITHVGTEAAQKTWYAVMWFWLEAKLKFACGMLIAMFSAGIPAAAAPTGNGNQDGGQAKVSIGKKKDSEDRWETIFVQQTEFKQGAFSFMQEIDAKNRRTEAEFLLWSSLKKRTFEFLFWPNRAKSRIGMGFSIDTSGSCYGELNGTHAFDVFGGGKGFFFWQAKKSIFGLDQKPDCFQINGLRATWPVGNKLAIGPDSKLSVTDRQSPTYRLGAILEVKLGAIKLRLRQFWNHNGSQPSFECWLFAPLGGTGP